MMNSILPSPEETSYSSVVWTESQIYPHVKFAVRRPSLRQRLELLDRVRELSLKHEFLSAGELTDQLSAQSANLLVQKLYLEWGIAEVAGLTIDGLGATCELVIEKGPDKLADEMVSAIQAECGLSEEERKNS